MKIIAAVIIGLHLGPMLLQQPAPKGQVKVNRDFRRLVRVFDLGDRRAGNIYNKERPVGQRMFLSADASLTEDESPLAALGVSLFQSETDPLGTPETGDGVWDWRPYNTARQRATDAGVDWSLFLHATFPPDWYRKSGEFTRLQCLTHHRPVEAFSPWDPVFAKFIDRTWMGARTRYGTLPAITVGIHGDYGDAGLMTGLRMLVPEQKAEWEQRFGNDHDHLDFWCADELALANFRGSMLRQYGTMDALNEAWLTGFESAQEIEFPTTPKLSYRARLDFINWYKNGVTSMTDTFAKIARRVYPDALMMIPIGAADETVRIGHDMTALTKTASRHGAAIRCTNGGYGSLPVNHATSLAPLRAACRFYNVPLWLASAAPSDEAGFAQRWFEALSVGAYGYFDWQANWRNHSSFVERNAKLMTRTQPTVEIACLFPTSAHELRPLQRYPLLMLNGLIELRDYLDYDVLDERLVQDGGLIGYRIAVLWEGSIWRKETLDKLYDWVSAGGVLLAYDFGKFSTPEGDLTPFNTLFGFATKLTPLKPGDYAPRQDWARPMGKGWVVYFPAQQKDRAGFMELIRKVASGAFPPGVRPIVGADADNVKDGVYATVCTDRIVYLNTTEQSVTREFKAPDWKEAKTVTIEPHGIAALMFGPAPQELLFQCEKFTDLGRLKTTASLFCMPGAGDTGVLLEVGRPISTRVTIAEGGTYRVLARAIEQGQGVTLNLSFDGTPLAAKASRPAFSDVSYYGEVELSAGIHTISVSGPGGAVADFLLLTNDTTISGYRFPPANR